jgi:hypothetical protein
MYNFPPIIKTTVHEYQPLWVKKEFLVYDEQFRAARIGMHDKMDTCFQCDHKFDDGEIMGLMAVKKDTNKVLCQSCADLLLNQAIANIAGDQ